MGCRRRDVYVCEHTIANMRECPFFKSHGGKKSSDLCVWCGVLFWECTNIKAQDAFEVHGLSMLGNPDDALGKQ